MNPDTPSDPEAFVPVDEVFAALLTKARAQQAARDKLESASNVVLARQAREANILAARMQWKPVTAVALIDEQVCRSCGSTAQMFRGFGILMRRAVDQTNRIIPTQGLDAGLPVQRYYLHSVSDACIECLPERNI